MLLRLLIEWMLLLAFGVVTLPHECRNQSCTHYNDVNSTEKQRVCQRVYPNEMASLHCHPVNFPAIKPVQKTANAGSDYE
jgi:hypothetical protein